MLHIYFRRITALHNVISIRHKSVKIVQVEAKKITKADRIKKLHFENKYLYGAKHKEKENKTNQVEIPLEENADPKDISSEIYWTCLHVPEVQDFTKPTKGRKKKKLKDEEPIVVEKTEKPVRKPKDVQNLVKVPLKLATNSKVKKITVKAEGKNASTSPVTAEVPIESAVKFVPRRKPPREIIKVPQLPDSLTRFYTDLPDVKLKIKNTLNNSFKLPSMESESDDSSDALEIPFESHQLRAILNFPLTLSNSKLINTFDKFIPEETSIPTPSVSKILQSTMPQSQRLALVKWKNMKISELGLEGFEQMQQCKKLLMSSQM